MRARNIDLKASRSPHHLCSPIHNVYKSTTIASGEGGLVGGSRTEKFEKWFFSLFFLRPKKAADSRPCPFSGISVSLATFGFQVMAVDSADAIPRCQVVLLGTTVTFYFPANFKCESGGEST